MKVLFLFFLSLTSCLARGQVELTPERTIVIGGVISNATYQPTMDALDNLSKTGKEIDIIFSSPGGSVIVGSLIIDKMEQLKLQGIHFRCAVRDIAASMAFQLLLHCNERYTTPHSFLLWHPVRLLFQGALTADMASTLATQLAQADEVALHDLRAYLPVAEADLIWHFKNETLHQGYNLMLIAPGFFKEVTNNITNLHPEKPALDTTSLGGFFGSNQIIYIHEKFIRGIQ